MTKKTLIQIRTNTNFGVNYANLELAPAVELIMLFTEPEYQINKKNDVIKGQKLSEFRIKTSIEGVNQIIGELQALQVQLQTFSNLSEGINAIIKQNVKQKEG
jgi:hypothetical protein